MEQRITSVEKPYFYLFLYSIPHMITFLKKYVFSIAKMEMLILFLFKFIFYTAIMSKNNISKRCIVSFYLCNSLHYKWSSNNCTPFSSLLFNIYKEIYICQSIGWKSMESNVIDHSSHLISGNPRVIRILFRG